MTICKEVFQRIFDENTWGEPETISGPGSTLEQTKTIRKEIPVLLKDYGINSMLDLPCGDFHWFPEMNLNIDTYYGVDIISEIIEKNKQLYSSDKYSFLCLDGTIDLLPKVDLILCRDLLVHFEEKLIIKTLQNFKQSGAQYLLTTSYPTYDGNEDIMTGEWRRINLSSSQYGLGEPIKIINEQTTEATDYEDKSLCLWKLSN